MSITAAIALLYLGSVFECSVEYREKPAIDIGKAVGQATESRWAVLGTETESMRIPRPAHDATAPVNIQTPQQLEEWARVDPAAAIAWTERLVQPERWEAIKAVMAGTAGRSDAVALVSQFIADSDGIEAADYGPAFIAALVASKQYPAALRFASTAAESFREDWLAMTIQLWASHDPESAARSCSQLTDVRYRGIASRALVDHWSPAQIAGLGSYVHSLPPGELRSYAFERVLNQWGLQDPANMAHWLKTLRDGAELDRGAAWLATHTDSANGSPEVALAWVETIHDPQLRMDSAIHAVDQWMQSDPQSAREYVESAHWLSPDQRARFLQALAHSQGLRSNYLNP